jgi:hypothetical protein
LARRSRRRAASREREVWLGLTDIDCRGNQGGPVEGEDQCAEGTQAVAKEGMRGSIRLFDLLRGTPARRGVAAMSNRTGGPQWPMSTRW